jgi:hypothetical protein
MEGGFVLVLATMNLSLEPKFPTFVETINE